MLLDNIVRINRMVGRGLGESLPLPVATNKDPNQQFINCT